MRIGRAAAQTGLSVDAIRFYEKQHLLERASRTEGGFRLFDAPDIERLLFIRRAQRLGFALPEIRELLVLQRDRTDACSHVRELLASKVSAVRHRIQELRLLEKQLATRLRRCDRKLRVSGDSHTGCCPVLDEIAHRDADEH